MTVNLIKLSVGVESIEHLATIQARRRQDAQTAGLGDRLWHQTRHMPRRADELLDGGSIYWVIKGNIRMRQLVTELERVTVDDWHHAVPSYPGQPAHRNRGLAAPPLPGLALSPRDGRPARSCRIRCRR